MTELDAIQRAILIEGLEDYYGLWRAVKRVRQTLGEVEPDVIRASVLNRVGPLLTDGLIEPGFPAEGGGFSAWDVEAEGAIRRIEAEWQALGRDPNIWDICWFRNTEPGDALARTLTNSNAPVDQDQ